MNLRTRLAYKAEHVIDLKTEAILEAEIYHANVADTATLGVCPETRLRGNDFERRVLEIAATMAGA